MSKAQITFESMPDNCLDCKVCMKTHQYNTVWLSCPFVNLQGSIADQEMYSRERHSDCPIDYSMIDALLEDKIEYWEAVLELSKGLRGPETTRIYNEILSHLRGLQNKI